MKHTRRRKLHQKRLPLRKLLLRKDSITKQQYSRLRKSKFINNPLSLKQKDFIVEIYRKFKIKGGGNRFVKINPDEFIKGKSYEIYIKHKPTRQRRLLAIGKLG